MKVKELIDALERCEPDAYACFGNSGPSGVYLGEEVFDVVSLDANLTKGRKVVILSCARQIE